MSITFLITGGGRDIGQAIALRLAGSGAFGVIHYTHSRQGAEQTLLELRSAGGDGCVIQADFRSDAEVSRFLTDVGLSLGDRNLDAIVLNAASTAPTPLGATQVGALNDMLAVNVLAPQRIVDALAPKVADGGAIVALSIAAVRQVFSPDVAFFAATKAAVDVLVRGWAVALGGRGVRVNAVAPGVVDANFRSELLKDAAFKNALERETALGRAGRVDDIADVVAFLTSDKARWITGQVIDASGGWKL